MSRRDKWESYLVAVVNKDVESGVVAFGSPAKVIRENQMMDFNKYVEKRLS